jgi:hypothetical protein
VLRERDLARAAKAEKLGFWADIEGYFFIFRFGGGARAGRPEIGGATFIEQEVYPRMDANGR